MASNPPRQPHSAVALWTQSNGLTPLAPAPPLLPYPQMNVALTASLPSAPPEEELTTDLHFPVRLHYMLTDIHREGLFTHIISFQPHGRCFVVHDKKQFVDKILCLWFRQSKWASFQRQLNMYGFKRLTHGLDKNGYYHDLFIQTQPKLAQRIQRQKLKGTGHRRAAQPDTEPNFYAMPSICSPMPHQYHQLPPGCGHPAPATITLRNSLTTHILAAPDMQPRAVHVRATAERKPHCVAENLPIIFNNRSHATMNEEDEKDLEALAQLASWF